MVEALSKRMAEASEREGELKRAEQALGAASAAFDARRVEAETAAAAEAQRAADMVAAKDAAWAAALTAEREARAVAVSTATPWHRILSMCYSMQ